MLSICIPVFNYDMGPLVDALHRQASQVDAPVEILLLDDASDAGWQKQNRRLASLPLVRYDELEQNVGRSRIRNLLCSKARFDWLLFMDCDSLPPDQLFLQRYLEATGEEAVVCGGRTYLPAPPPGHTRLHWWYGLHREVHPASHRSRNPWHSFMTNNFMVPRSILCRIPFNEHIREYGHEDTLFGYELKKQGIKVRHIDNPLLHIGLENHAGFLGKTRQGISNLWHIHNLMGKPDDFTSMVKILRVYHRLERLRLTRAFCGMTLVLQGLMQKNLSGRTPRLVYLDLLKLRWLCLEAKKTEGLAD